MIPDAAVEAAAALIHEYGGGRALGRWAEEAEANKSFYRDRVRLALEAAAPHMLAGPPHE